MADDILSPDALAEFCQDSANCTVTALGSGNINDTYLIQSGSHAFVLQRINGNVFPEPLRVIENFQKVTDHLVHKQDQAKQQLRVAEPILTRNNCLFYRDTANSYWRAQTYIRHKSYRVLTSPEQARDVGQILATFHRCIADLDLQGFLDPLPGFHHLPSYLKEYDREIQKRGIGVTASKEFRSCLAAVERYRHRATTVEDAKDAGILILQPIHGDPKVDNFIFNDQGKGVGLLDLDTVAMGLVHYDLGDCLRSCCNRSGEAGKDDVPVHFDMTLCQALLDGYFSGPVPLLSKEQRGYVFDGVLLICFELGLRFFTDHLRGNPYFKVQRDGDNLVRAVKQFRLADDIAQREQEIRAMVLHF
jgi:Ser/Thr protein kinase RdoA (MazF antagonist)